MTQLPKGWALATVGEVSEPPQYGWTTKASESGQVKFLRTTDITKGPIQWDTVPFCSESPGDLSKFQLTEGDIVVSRAGSVGASALIVGEPPLAAFASYLIRFRPSRSFDERYLAFFLHSPAYWQEIADSAAGIALQNVNAKKLAAIALPVAPLAEQERIVTAIEEAFSKLDAGEAGLRTVRQLLKRMRDAILTAAVTGRLVPQDPTDTPAAKLLADLGVHRVEEADLPNGWAFAELGDLLDDIEAGKSFATQGRPAQAGEVGVIKVSAMTWGEFRPAENKALPPDAAIDERWLIRAGDLLLSRANTADYVGACVLVQRDHDDLILSDKSLRLRTAAGVDRRWLLYALRSRPAREQIERLATGTKESMRNISQAKLRSLRVSLPSPEEQIRIADEVERQFSFVDACERAVDVGLARAAGLRRSVLKAAFEGRLLPQDPSDEPASVLLDRIRAERAAQPVAKRRARQRT